jgi:hypothetical protein
MTSTPKEFEDYEIARDVVRLITRLGLRKVVLRMLIKDIANLNEFLSNIQ